MYLSELRTSAIPFATATASAQAVKDICSEEQQPTQDSLIGWSKAP
jgi:hypothetical protein